MFIRAETVTSGRAANGIQLTYETDNATYVEIYVAGVLDPEQIEDLQEWNAILTGGTTYLLA